MSMESFCAQNFWVGCSNLSGLGSLNGDEFIASLGALVNLAQLASAK